MNKMADSSRRIADLPPAKLALLARRLKEKTAPVERSPIIPRRDPSEDVIPLLPSQQDIWVMGQLHPDLPFYNIPSSWPFKGKVSLSALEQALNETVRRHEILRTTIPVIKGEPVQVIALADSLNSPIVDLRGLSEKERWKQAERLSLQDRLRQFNLDKEWPLRVRFLILNQEQIVLLHVVHHITFDGWSSTLFLMERETLYKAFANGAPSPLAELPLQCGDIALWYQRWLRGQEAESQLAYWRRKLGDSSQELELPTDRPRMGQPFLGAWQSTQVPAAPTEALRRLTHQEGATLFMTLLAALKGLLFRYTGQDDISVGTLFSTRNRAEVEGLIGPFFNTLIMRTQVSGCLTFRELLRSVRQTTLAAYSHSDYPFVELVEDLRSSGNLGSGPPFRVKFGVEPPSSAAKPGELFGMAMEGLNERPALDLETRKSRTARTYKNIVGQAWLPENLGVNLEHDFVLYVHEGDYLQVRTWYTSNLFDAATIARLLRHFRTFVEEVVSHPDQPIATANLLTEACRHQLFKEWNDTQCDDGGQETFSPLFEAQVKRTPDAVAVTCGDAQVSYGELNRRTICLARHLQEIGVGPESLVAVAAGRGIEFLTAMVAVFKLGAAYLPLDPSDPAMRLRQILSQSQARVLLTTNEFITAMSDALMSLEAIKRPAVVSMTMLARLKVPSGFSVDRHSQDRAYVMYTSGSTGAPKGVMVEQAGMVNHLLAKIADLQLTEADSVVQNASPRFDISVWQFLAVLLVGGRVHIVDDETAHAPLRLLEVVEREAITILEAVPSLLSAALDEITADVAARPQLSTLRWLLVTGEAVPPETCAQWLTNYPGLPLLNAYGPTECSDDVTHYAVRGAPAKDVIHMPIGRPVRNTQLYVLDPLTSPMPIGVPGELHIGGKGVGRGYLNDPGRTAEVFVPDPFSSASGARLYKTGDVVCYRPDGNVEYRGRSDHQVKVRGFRVELAEIEIVLGRHPRIGQAVVIVRQDHSGDKQLVAYVVVSQEPAPTSAELIDFLLERLPDYMAPRTFVLLDALPLTSNGKIDRRALAVQTECPLPGSEEWKGPDSPIERRLAEIWSELFKVRQVGIYDNFFHLGGHSIKAVRAINRINQAFNVNLSVRSVFEEPTIAGLALLVEETLIAKLEAE